jgi:hypothetical protein
MFRECQQQTNNYTVGPNHKNHTENHTGVFVFIFQQSLNNVLYFFSFKTPIKNDYIKYNNILNIMLFIEFQTNINSDINILYP